MPRSKWTWWRTTSWSLACYGHFFFYWIVWYKFVLLCHCDKQNIDSKCIIKDKTLFYIASKFCSIRSFCNKFNEALAKLMLQPTWAYDRTTRRGHKFILLSNLIQNWWLLNQSSELKWNQILILSKYPQWVPFYRPQVRGSVFENFSRSNINSIILLSANQILTQISYKTKRLRFI